MSQEIIKIVLTTPIDEQSVQLIKAVSHRIHVEQVSPLLVAEKKGDFVNREKLTLLLQEAEIIYGWINHFPKDLLERTARLKWIQTMSAGVDRLSEEIMKSHIRIVTVGGLHKTPMGEVVLEMMLMFAKDAPSCLRMKQAREWKRFRPRLLKGQTVGILGLGVIGREIARLCRAFGMTVTGIRRSAGPEHLFRKWIACIPGKGCPNCWPRVTLSFWLFPLRKKQKD